MRKKRGRDKKEKAVSHKSGQSVGHRVRTGKTTIKFRSRSVSFRGDLPLKILDSTRMRLLDGNSIKVSEYTLFPLNSTKTPHSIIIDIVILTTRKKTEKIGRFEINFTKRTINRV